MLPISPLHVWSAKVLLDLHVVCRYTVPVIKQVTGRVVAAHWALRRQKMPAGSDEYLTAMCEQVGLSLHFIQVRPEVMSGVLCPSTKRVIVNHLLPYNKRRRVVIHELAEWLIRVYREEQAAPSVWASYRGTDRSHRIALQVEKIADRLLFF